MSDENKLPERIWAGKYRSTWWQSRPHHQMTEYIRADLAAPKVKPLVWEDRKTVGEMMQYRVHIGYGLMNGVFALTLSGSTIGEFSSEEAAKAAAQADYERRILDALE